MTPETLVVVLLLLVVKYTLEFADRRRWREKRRPRRRASGPAGPQQAANAGLPARAAQRPASGSVADPDPAPTGDPFWDMVNARIASPPDDAPPEDEPLH